MKRFLMVLGIIISAMLLQACAPQKVIVKETEIVVLEPPASFLKDCEVAAPPNKEVYLKSRNAQEREELLVEFGRDQTAAIRTCNKDKKSTREWVAKEKENLKKAEREKNANRK